jgi:hypothetical protein
LGELEVVSSATQLVVDLEVRMSLSKIIYPHPSMFFMEKGMGL